MLDENQLLFIEKELLKKGSIKESVQDILDTDPSFIYELCDEIMNEESALDGGVRWDEKGNMTEYLAKENYSPHRMHMAEGIYIALSRILEED